MHLADTVLVRQESFHNPQRGGAATKHSLSSIGWRRGLGRGGAAPLLGPLPTPASWEEEEEKRATKNRRSLRQFRPILIGCNSALRKRRETHSMTAVFPREERARILERGRQEEDWL